MSTEMYIVGQNNIAVYYSVFFCYKAVGILDINDVFCS